MIFLNSDRYADNFQIIEVVTVFTSFSLELSSLVLARLFRFLGLLAFRFLSVLGFLLFAMFLVRWRGAKTSKIYLKSNVCTSDCTISPWRRAWRRWAGAGTKKFSLNVFVRLLATVFQQPLSCTHSESEDELLSEDDDEELDRLLDFFLLRLNFSSAFRFARSLNSCSFSCWFSFCSGVMKSSSSSLLEDSSPAMIGLLPRVFRHWKVRWPGN